MDSITLQPGEHRPWVTAAGSVTLREQSGFPSYDPASIDPAHDDVRWSAAPWRSNPRVMTWRRGDRIVARASVRVGSESPPAPSEASPFAEHPRFDPALTEGALRLPQGGVRTVPEPRVALPHSVEIEHLPGAWRVRWQWHRLTEPLDRRYRASAVQVFARPTRERGSGSAWASLLREYSATGRGQPWGPWEMEYPRAVSETRDDGSQVMTEFPAGTLFDLRLLIHGARFPLDYGDGGIVGQGITLPAGKRPSGVSMSVWQSRIFPTVDPLTAEEVAALTDETLASAQSLAVRAALSGRTVASGELRSALQRAGVKLALYSLDHRYRAVSEDILDEWLADDDTQAAQYVSESWDCDNFATALCARASTTLGNCCGVVVDFSGGHAYNCFAVLRDDELAVRFVEPQTDMTVNLGDTLSGTEAYKGERGYIHWP